MIPPSLESGVVLNDAEISERDSSHMLACAALPALTPSQHRVLNAIEEHVDARGYPPSLRELAGATDLAKTTVEEKLGALVRLGYLRRDAGEDRGLAVLVSARVARVVEPRPMRKTVHLCSRCRRDVA